MGGFPSGSCKSPIRFLPVPLHCSNYDPHVTISFLSTLLLQSPSQIALKSLIECLQRDKALKCCDIGVQDFESLPAMGTERNCNFDSLVYEAVSKYVERNHLQTWIVEETENILVLLCDLYSKVPTYPELVGKNVCSGDLCVADAVFVPVSSFPLAEAISVQENTEDYVIPDISERKFHIKSFPVEVSHVESAEVAIVSCDQMKIPRLIKSCSWLIPLMTAMEKMPISLTVSGVTSCPFEFPLIYVNKHFEISSGVERKQMIGSSGMLLQTKRLMMLLQQRKSIHIFMDAIKDGLSIVQMISCSSVHGRLFDNTIGVKPIFNSSKGLCYVVTVQMETLRRDCVKKDILLVDKLLDAISGYALE